MIAPLIFWIERAGGSYNIQAHKIDKEKHSYGSEDKVINQQPISMR